MTGTPQPPLTSKELQKVREFIQNLKSSTERVLDTVSGATQLELKERYIGYFDALDEVQRYLQEVDLDSIE